MTLRTRLALALASLAGLSVVAVGALNYVVTSRSLYDSVDASLKSYAAALTGTDAAGSTGVIASRLTVQCRRDGVALGTISPAADAGTPDIVQCVRDGGETIPMIGDPSLRLEGSGRPAGAGVTAGPWTERLRGQRYHVMAVRLPDGEIRIARSLAGTERVLDSLRAESLALGATIIALAGLAGVLVARWTTEPVTRLTRAAEAIAASGDLAAEVPVRRRDEVGRLARAFAAMIAALARSREQQQSLVQDAGHELRTPLTSLRTNVDTLRRHAALDPVLRERVLTDLDSELRELSSLVDELVVLAMDRYDAEPEQEVDLAALVERAAERARRRTGRTVVVDAVPITVRARPGRLLRAVGNLLDNALKFSPDGTPIEVTARPERLVVRDYGPGIAATDLPHVFERFYRSVAARSVPGSGLGLAIVREVTDDWGARVEAANHPGGGAMFTLELPTGTPRSVGR